MIGLWSNRQGDAEIANVRAVSIPDHNHGLFPKQNIKLKDQRGDGRKYFQDWQATVNSIANESLRKKAQKRLDAVRTSYDKVEASLQVAGEKCKPFLSDLGDIQKALAADVTAGGVKAIRSTVRSANWDHQFVNRAVNSALKDMSKMENALSSEAK